MVLTSLVLSKEEQMDYKDLTYPFAQKALENKTICVMHCITIVCDQI